MIAAAAALGLLAVFAQTSGPMPDGGRVTVILDQSTAAPPFLDQLLRPEWRALREQSAAALLNCSVPGEQPAASTALAVATGERIPLPRGWMWTPDRPVAAAPDRSLTAASSSLVELCERSGVEVQVLSAASRDDLRLLATLNASGETRRPASFNWPPGRQQAPRGPGLNLILPPPGAAAADLLLLLESLTETRRPGEMILFASLTPGRWRSGFFGDLAPLLLIDGKGSGSLTSLSTRQPGLVALPDLHAAVVRRLTLSSSPGSGPPTARFRRIDISAAELKVRARAASIAAAAMEPLLWAWGLLVLAGVVAVGGSLLRSEGGPLRSRISLCLTFVASGPVAFLLAALYPWQQVWQLWLAVTAAMVVLTAAVQGFIAGRFHVSRIIAIYVVTLAVIAIDLLSGGQMLARNLMSNFAIIGARHYGIGNEYCGVLLGAASFAPFTGEASSRSPAGLMSRAALLWLGLALLVGHPSLGADFGGALTTLLAGAAACLAAWTLVLRRKIAPLHLLAGASILIILPLLIVVADLARPAEERTHIGAAVHRLFTGDGSSLLPLVAGKILLNLRMLRSAPSLFGFLTAGLLLAAGARLFGTRVQALLDESPDLRAGLATAVIAGAVSLFLNDTGVISFGISAGAALLVLIEALMLGPNGRYAKASKNA